MILEFTQTIESTYGRISGELYSKAVYLFLKTLPPSVLRLDKWLFFQHFLLSNLINKILPHEKLAISTTNPNFRCLFVIID